MTDPSKLQLHQSKRPPAQRWTIEVCNDCGGLVGWDQWRDGCCLGGVACRRHNGTRFLHVLQVKR